MDRLKVNLPVKRFKVMVTAEIQSHIGLAWVEVLSCEPGSFEILSIYNRHGGVLEPEQVSDALYDEIGEEVRDALKAEEVGK